MKIDFHDALQTILDEHREFHSDAYQLLYASATPESNHALPSHHLSAEELYTTFCRKLLKEYGPLALTVLNYWGFHSVHDIGTAVYYLVAAGAVSKRRDESAADFDSLPSLEVMLLTPFEPAPTA